MAAGSEHPLSYAEQRKRFQHVPQRALAQLLGQVLQQRRASGEAGCEGMTSLLALGAGTTGMVCMQRMPWTSPPH